MGNALYDNDEDSDNPIDKFEVIVFLIFFFKILRKLSLEPHSFRIYGKLWKFVILITTNLELSPVLS